MGAVAHLFHWEAMSPFNLKKYIYIYIKETVKCLSSIFLRVLSYIILYHIYIPERVKGLLTIFHSVVYFIVLDCILFDCILFYCTVGLYIVYIISLDTDTFLNIHWLYII